MIDKKKFWVAKPTRDEAIALVKEAIKKDDRPVDGLKKYLEDNATEGIYLKSVIGEDGLPKFSQATRKRNPAATLEAAYLKYCPIMHNICWFAGHWPGTPSCCRHPHPNDFNSIKKCMKDEDKKKAQREAARWKKKHGKHHDDSTMPIDFNYIDIHDIDGEEA